MNFTNNPSTGNQFTIRRYGRSYNSSNIILPNIRMQFIKSNNYYYNPHTAYGRVGASTSGANSRAIRRRT
jgi:hypothetical protein